MTFSPNGQFLISASRDQSVRVWRAATGECLQILPGHQTQVVACRFSPDGQWLVTASVDETIKLWAVETGKCLATLPLQQPYAGMKLTHATGLTVAQRAACKALGAVE